MAEDIALLKTRVYQLTDQLDLVEKKNRAYRNEVHRAARDLGQMQRAMRLNTRAADEKRFSNLQLISTVGRGFEKGPPHSLLTIEMAPGHLWCGCFENFVMHFGVKVELAKMLELIKITLYSRTGFVLGEIRKPAVVQF